MSKTNAQKLKRIEKEKELIIDGITNKIIGVELTLSDYAFLHSEVGRAQETENLLKEYQTDWAILIPELTKLKDENNRLREALNAPG